MIAYELPGPPAPDGYFERAHQRLVRLIHTSPAELLPEQRRLVTQGPEVSFTWGVDVPLEERERVRPT